MLDFLHREDGRHVEHDKRLLDVAYEFQHMPAYIFLLRFLLKIQTQILVKKLRPGYAHQTTLRQSDVMQTQYC